jgi:paraquat-inducible protein B
MTAETRSTERSFVAAFDDATGIKLRSNVLFKGIPVGTVGAMEYDTQGKKALVRIDLQKDLPEHIQPYLIASLMGEGHVGLDTAKPGDPGFTVALPKKVNARSQISDLPVVNGIRQSQGEAFSPGIDAVVKTLQSTLETAQSSLKTSQTLFEQAQSLTAVTQQTIQRFSDDMDVLLMKPLQNCIDEIEALISGQGGNLDPTLNSTLRDITNELKAHSESLRQVFQGKNGLLQLGPLLTKTAESLKKAGDTIASTKGQFEKLGTASTDVSNLAKEFTAVGKLLKERPQALIWGRGKQSSQTPVKEP